MTSLRFRERLERSARAGTLAFLAVVALQHALAPELTPTRHMVSEYANARAGGLMVGGFLAWAVALAATAALARVELRRSSHPRAAAALVASLALAAGACLVTACFRTQAVAGALPPGVAYSLRGRLHDLGSGILALALFAAVASSAFAMRRPRWFRRLALAAFGFAVACEAVLLPLGREVGGLRQRLLLLAACGWQLGLVAALARRRTRACDE